MVRPPTMIVSDRGGWSVVPVCVVSSELKATAVVHSLRELIDSSVIDSVIDDFELDSHLVDRMGIDSIMCVF